MPRPRPSELPTTLPTDERRRHPRRRCRVPARTPTGGHLRALDLSEGGASIERLDGAALTLGELIPIELELPDGPLHVEGQVIALSEGGATVGGRLRFEPIAPSARRRLRALSARPTLRPGARALGRIALVRRAALG